MKTKQKHFKEKQAFENQLMEQHRSDDTVEQHISNVNYFYCWLKEKKLGNIIRANASIILFYTKAKVKIGTINNRLNSLRKYYDCLIGLGYISHNPASGIHVGRQEKKVVSNPLDTGMLDALYQKFETFLDNKITTNRSVEQSKFSHLRFKLITSLMIYQALDTGELDALHVSDIDMLNRKIYISPKPRRRSRVLELHASQMIPINNYLQMIPANQTKLFAMAVQKNMPHLLKYIKGVEPQIRNAEHIRQSRIMVWVSTLKLREAQYRIGHKFATSTEKYEVQNTADLVDEINRIHVFG